MVATLRLSLVTFLRDHALVVIAGYVNCDHPLEILINITFHSLTPKPFSTNSTCADADAPIVLFLDAGKVARGPGDEKTLLLS